MSLEYTDSGVFSVRRCVKTSIRTQGKQAALWVWLELSSLMQPLAKKTGCRYTQPP